MARISKHTIRALYVTGSIAAIVYAEGFFALFFHQHDAGEYNPPVAIAVAALVAVFIGFRQRVPLWNAFVLLAALATVIILAAKGGSSAQKLFRDYLYLIILLGAFNFFRWVLDSSMVGVKSLSFYIAIFVIVVFPLIGFAVGMKGFDGRFPGFMLSPPVFANAVMLAYLMVRNARLGSLWTVFFFICAIVCIASSGTRSPLFTVAMYELLLLVSGEAAERNRFVNLIFIGAAGAMLGLLAADLYGSFSARYSDFRIFSQADSDGGSLQTRTSWYADILNGLSRDDYVGGFGAGAAERLTGYITHFDILRYWYDYSIFYVGIFLFSILKMYRLGGRVSCRGSVLYSALIYPFVAMNMLLLSMHNVFQIPGLVLLVAIYLNNYLVQRGRKNEN
jgi:hypothetical protein